MASAFFIMMQRKIGGAARAFQTICRRANRAARTPKCFTILEFHTTEIRKALPSELRLRTIFGNWQQRFYAIREEAGRFIRSLPKQNVDFGGGLERIAMAVANIPDIIEVCHRPILDALEKMSAKNMKALPRMSLHSGLSRTT